MARRPGVIGSGGFTSMRIGEATRLAMQSDVPGRAGGRTAASSKSITADLEEETKQLLAAIRGGGGASSKAKFSRTDSSIKTEELEPDSARRRKKKGGKKKPAPVEAFVRTKTPPVIEWHHAPPRQSAQNVRMTVEMADDESTPRSMGSDVGSLPDSDVEASVGPTLTEPRRAVLRAEEYAIKDLDFDAEEARVRDDADQFVPKPAMTKAELEREAARLRAAESKKQERRRVEAEGTGSRSVRKRAYAEQEAAIRIQAALRGKAGRDRAKKFKEEMEKAYERAVRSGQVMQEVVDPASGDVYIVNTEARTYVRTGAVARLPHLAPRPSTERGKHVRGGPAPRSEPERRRLGDKQVHLPSTEADSALMGLERSVAFAASVDSGGFETPSVIPGFKMAAPSSVTSGFAKQHHLPASSMPPMSPMRPPSQSGGFSTQQSSSKQQQDFLPRIPASSGLGESGGLDSPRDTLSIKDDDEKAIDPLDIPQVATTATSLRTTVQAALKCVGFTVLCVAVWGRVGNAVFACRFAGLRSLTACLLCSPQVQGLLDSQWNLQTPRRQCDNLRRRRSPRNLASLKLSRLPLRRRLKTSPCKALHPYISPILAGLTSVSVRWVCACDDTESDVFGCVLSCLCRCTSGRDWWRDCDYICRHTVPACSWPR
jgi:hypothetical protein